MSLAKIPVVAIISLAFKAMLTSPQPDPPKGEEVPSATVDVSKARDIILTTSYIVLAAAEIATILAYASPSSPLSQQLLSTLVFAGGDPSRLRLNISSILGAVLWLAGAALRMQAYQYMGKFFRFTVSIQKDHKLITTGPYAYVRHPSYSGLMLADIGWFLWNGSQGSWIRESGLWDNGVGRSVVVLFTLFFILSPPFVTFLRVAKEDDALKKQFGKEWLEWQKNVPYRIIPVAKIPLIVVLTFTFNAMFTSPNPAPAKEDLVATTKIDWVSGRNFILYMSRMGQTLLAAIEIAVIIANTNPSSLMSRKILHICLFEGSDPNTLQLHPLSYLAAFFWICGYAMRMRTYQDLGRFFRFDISIQKDHQLVTTGLYAYVRHPSYSGIVLADLGWALWYGTRGSWVRESGFLDSVGGRIALATFIVLFMLPGPAFTLPRMSSEDKALRNKFGKKWDEWAKKVPYRLIPGAMLTPPHPPPKAEEVIPSTKTDFNMLRLYRLHLAHIGQFMLAAVEMATLVAHASSSSSASQRELSSFLLGGRDPNRLHLSYIGAFGVVLWICGAALRIRTYRDLGRFFRFQISIQKDHELIKTGPYAYVRHPSYTGLTLAITGWFLYHGAQGSWVRESGFLEAWFGQAVLAAYLIPTLIHMQVLTLSRMSNEDAALRKKFGQEWDNWAKDVPYLLIPGIY
ncbi:hypothetical protein CVT25_002297 [Psilocybe cyanescens]|uniref:Protein-S-isoprenylcysteine O-methyltransferase n=1 Tax=Psilocybe cyanescens TaxID=93625 RepID=A0A409WKQ3_PSICY|nr:hypothetical protein CVT25_002297 [Psilocybe cyanescens]